MKILFLVTMLCSSVIALGQNKLSVSGEKEIGTGAILDTTNMYASKYGNVARLSWDNMPCILPYRNAKPMPNPIEGKSIPNDIPNLWKGKKVPVQKLPKRYTPNLWKKDSMKMEMRPIK